MNLELSEQELQCLVGYADDDQEQAPPLEVLARLEKLGLLMRGWTHQHYVTELGRIVIDRSRA